MSIDFSKARSHASFLRALSGQSDFAEDRTAFGEIADFLEHLVETVEAAAGYVMHRHYRADAPIVPAGPDPVDVDVKPEAAPTIQPVAAPAVAGDVDASAVAAAAVSPNAVDAAPAVAALAPAEVAGDAASPAAA
jgi:hypothetical protein